MGKSIKDIHIILNYGHAKNTPGKHSPKYSTLTRYDQEYFKQFPEFGEDRFYEWMSNRVIGKKIATTLRERGWNVHEVYPEGDADMPLNTVVAKTNEICKKYKATNCVFVSIHSNALGNGTSWMSARGWCIYTTKGKTISDKFADYVFKYAESEFKEQAQKVRKDMGDGDPDYEANFTVIKGAKCAAILTESFFYDNLHDLKYLVSDQGQHDIVWVHVQGIEDYIYNEKINK